MLNPIAATKIYYKGKVDIVVDSVKYHCYKFSKSIGKIDGVETYIYLDKDFVLVKEELVHGYSYFRKMERVRKKPDFLQTQDTVENIYN